MQIKEKEKEIEMETGKERNDCLPFYIFCENGKFTTNVNRKKTFSGVYATFKSFIRGSFKIGLIKSSPFWCFIFDFIKFHHGLIS